MDISRITNVLLRETVDFTTYEHMEIGQYEETICFLEEYKSFSDIKDRAKYLVQFYEKRASIHAVRLLKRLENLGLKDAKTLWEKSWEDVHKTS